MKKALGITLLTVLAHLDAASEQRHPELVKGAPVSAHRQTRDARSGRVAGAGSLARPYAIALALLAGICLVLALAACGETNGIDIEATATAVALANDRPVSGTPEESASFESTRLGEWVEGSGLAMVAYAVEDPAVPNTNLYEPRPGTRLVGVELEIGCLLDSHHFTPQETSLIDSRGRRHEPAYRAMAEHKEIATGIISMGDRVRGWLAFELPEGVTAVSLEYKPIAWNRVIELRVSLGE